MKDTSQHIHSKSSISLLHRFFLLCSGASTELLLQCPRSEQVKYAGIGATVFFTGVLAALSSSYAFYMIFDSKILAGVFGLFWGAMILNLDRYIVSTVKKEGKVGKEILQMVPRLLLAIVLAFVISKPLELKIFEKEINQVLAEQQEEKVQEVDENYENKITEKETFIATTKGETEAKFKIREKYYSDYKCECDGTCGTGARGEGSECLRKKEKYEKTDREYQSIKAENNLLLSQTREQVKELQHTKREKIQETAELFSKGFLARLNALKTLPPEASYAIMLLLICIEITPIFTKLLSSRGPYDDLVQGLEYNYKIKYLEQVNKKNQELNKELVMYDKINKAEIEQTVTENKDNLRAISQAQQELMKERLAVWLDKEKTKLKDE